MVVDAAAAGVAVKAPAPKAVHHVPMAMSAVTATASVQLAMVIAQSNLAIVPPVVIVPHATATANPIKASALPVNLTTAVHAAMHRVLPATLTHPVRHVVTMTTSSPAPTRTWARKAA